MRPEATPPVRAPTDTPGPCPLLVSSGPRTATPHPRGTEERKRRPRAQETNRPPRRGRFTPDPTMAWLGLVAT